MSAGLECGITVFASSYGNLIGFSPLTSRFANINRAEIRGAEANCDWEIFAGFHWRTAYTYLHTQDIQYERELLRRPRHVLSASLQYRASAFTLSAEMVYVGKRLDYDELLWTVAESRSFSHLALALQLPLFKNVNAFCRVEQCARCPF